MKRFKTLLLPLLACLLGEAVVFRPTLTSGFGRMQADPGDTRLNNYNMERGFGWLTRTRPFENYWDPPFYYPLKNMGGTMDVQLASLPAYVPFRLVGIAPDTAFQFWMLAVAALEAAIERAVRTAAGRDGVPGLAD